MLWGAMVGIILKGRVTGKKRIVFYGTDKLIYIITEVSRHSFFTKLFVSTAEIFVKLGLFLFYQVNIRYESQSEAILENTMNNIIRKFYLHKYLEA